MLQLARVSGGSENLRACVIVRKRSHSPQPHAGEDGKDIRVTIRKMVAEGE